jgi:hypothetical protein
VHTVLHYWRSTHSRARGQQPRQGKKSQEKENTKEKKTQGKNSQEKMKRSLDEAEFDVSDMHVMKPAKIHGVMTGISPIKESKNGKSNGKIARR